MTSFKSSNSLIPKALKRGNSKGTQSIPSHRGSNREFSWLILWKDRAESRLLELRNESHLLLSRILHNFATCLFRPDCPSLNITAITVCKIVIETSTRLWSDLGSSPKHSPLVWIHLLAIGNTNFSVTCLNGLV